MSNEPQLGTDRMEDASHAMLLTTRDSHLFMAFPADEGSVVGTPRMAGIVIPGQAHHMVQRATIGRMVSSLMTAAVRTSNFPHL